MKWAQDSRISFMCPLEVLAEEDKGLALGASREVMAKAYKLQLKT